VPEHGTEARRGPRRMLKGAGAQVFAIAPDGTAHVIWNDNNGVYHTVSEDGGLTWNASSR